jgi:hypothetical protein
MTAILEIKNDIGELRATCKATNDALPGLFSRVRDLESIRDNQRGAARVWGLLTAAGGSLITAIVGGLLYLIKVHR